LGIQSNGKTSNQRLNRTAPLTAPSVDGPFVSGRPLLLGAVQEEADSIIAAWLPGTEGQGVADVLLTDLDQAIRLRKLVASGQALSLPSLHDSLPAMLTIRLVLALSLLVLTGCSKRGVADRSRAPTPAAIPWKNPTGSTGRVAPASPKTAPTLPGPAARSPVGTWLNTETSAKDALDLLPLLQAPCQEDPPTCRTLLKVSLDEGETLGLRLALCANGVGSACRWASVMMETDDKTRTAQSSWRRDVLERGCLLKDSPSCALLGATLAQNAAEGSNDAKRAETLLKQACANRDLPCHLLTTPDDVEAESMTGGRLLTDRRILLLQHAACAVAGNEKVCAELDRDEGQSEVVLPWSQTEVRESSCRGGSMSACLNLLMVNNHRKVPAAACDAQVGAACEALSIANENAKIRLRFTREACQLGRCNACEWLMTEANLKPHVSPLERGCYAGCKNVCALLSGLYSYGGRGIAPNSAKAGMFFSHDGM
jgi:hypothetical protein